MRFRTLLTLAAATGLLPVVPANAETQCNGAGLPEPVMFVLQYPVASDFATIGSMFANHRGGLGSAGRGGDLMICHPDGSLRNLTRSAGYGSTGFQGVDAISVRDPHIHWSGEKALFAMVVGAPAQQYQQRTDYWQLYEVTGLGLGQTVSITRIPEQPADYNNIQPAYLADDTIVFVSDRPRSGLRHHYPQLDEYESAPTPSGLWQLDPANGRLVLFEHSPSGSFQPFVDSHGRVVFTRWDHLMRDQMTSYDHWGAFDYASEAEDAPRDPVPVDLFPEPRVDTDLTFATRTNHFMPWMIRADGTGTETLNHIGRHEIFGYFPRSFRNDPSLTDYIAPGGRNTVLNLVQTAEDPTTPGRYLAINAPEFQTHSSGQLVAFDAPPSLQARDFLIVDLSDESGAGFYLTPPEGFARYRNPAMLSNGGIVATHTDHAGEAENLGTRAAPIPAYQFRARRLAGGSGGGQVTPGTALTNGITRAVSFWDPDVLVSYEGPFWELSPVPVRARPRPDTVTEPALEPPEQAAFDQAQADVASFKAFLRAWNLGVVVVRNATTRDQADRQQPFNLRVPGGVQTVAPGHGAHLRDIAHLQVVQGDQVRGYGGTTNPRAGRRITGRWLNDAGAVRFNPTNPDGPEGSVAIASDGSAAVLVPARRALSWQVNAPDGEPVVRERYWLSVQPGEIRACDGCHGVTPTNQAGQPMAGNPPAALSELLTWFHEHHDPVFSGRFQ